MAVPLTANRDDIAIWLRPEQRHSVVWAGDPASNIGLDAQGRRQLCIRESFDTWSHVTHSTCLPWTEHDLSQAKSAAIQLGLLTLNWYAAQASQAKTQFLSCMSHEIRTPMTAILGYANLLKEQTDSTHSSDTTVPCREYIDIIERNGHHLLTIIDDILNLAKIESGKLIVEQIPTQIRDLLLDVVAL